MTLYNVNSVIMLFKPTSSRFHIWRNAVARLETARLVDIVDDELWSVLNEIVRRLEANLSLQQLFIFGSRVSGTADEESDLDLLVIAPSNYRPLERRSMVRRLLADIDERIGLDILFYTPEEAHMFANDPASFLHSIMENGLKVYDEKTL
jgi:predicted nucleotidyltransferase